MREIPREGVPKASSTSVGFCEDPECGLHVIGYDEAGTPICEVVFSGKNTLELVKLIKAALYEKVTDEP